MFQGSEHILQEINKKMPKENIKIAIQNNRKYINRSTQVIAN